MNMNDAFPSKYLKASDLPEEGSETYTIEGVEIEEIGMDKERKPVLHFKETNKGFVLNKTNAKTISRVLNSEDFDDWNGHSINLYRCEVEFQGDMVEAIRVKAKTVKAKKAGKTEKTVDEDGENIPF
jgi:hypothetical protein